MSVEDAIKENEFLSTLKQDSGLDLAEWMAAINNANLIERNDIIDWLRDKGFNFSKASWLERIHNNKGQAIYSDDLPDTNDAPPKAPRALSTATTDSDVSSKKTDPPRASHLKLVASNPVKEKQPEAKQEIPTSQATVIAPKAPPTQSENVTSLPETSRKSKAAATPEHPQPLDDVLSAGKAYRPLAQFFVTELQKAEANLQIGKSAKTLAFARGLDDPMCLLAVTAKGLHLAVALDPDTPQTLLEPTKSLTLKYKFPSHYRFNDTADAPRPHGQMTHYCLLNDARQINETLIQHIKQSFHQEMGAVRP